MIFKHCLELIKFLPRLTISLALSMHLLFLSLFLFLSLGLSLSSVLSFTFIFYYYFPFYSFVSFFLSLPLLFCSTYSLIFFSLFLPLCLCFSFHLPFTISLFMFDSSLSIQNYKLFIKGSILRSTWLFIKIVS